MGQRSGKPKDRVVDRHFVPVLHVRAEHVRIASDTEDDVVSCDVLDGDRRRMIGRMIGVSIHNLGHFAIGHGAHGPTAAVGSTCGALGMTRSDVEKIPKNAESSRIQFGLSRIGFGLTRKFSGCDAEKNRVKPNCFRVKPI